MKLTKRDIQDGISLAAVMIGTVAANVVLIGNRPIDSGWGQAVMGGTAFGALCALYYLIIRERKGVVRDRPLSGKS